MRRTAFATILFSFNSSLHFSHRGRKGAEATEECMCLSLDFFPPRPSFLPTWELDGGGEERKGERRRRISALVSSALFIPTRFSTATFILFTVEDGERNRQDAGRQEESREEKTRCALASLMITQQKTCTPARITSGGYESGVFSK